MSFGVVLPPVAYSTTHLHHGVIDTVENNWRDSGILSNPPGYMSGQATRSHYFTLLNTSPRRHFPIFESSVNLQFEWKIFLSNTSIRWPRGLKRYVKDLLGVLTCYFNRSESPVNTEPVTALPSGK